MGFKPTISAGERPKTYALDRAATGTGTIYTTALEIMLTDLYLLPLQIRRDINNTFSADISTGNFPQQTTTPKLLLLYAIFTSVGTLIVATIYLQLIQNRYMFRSFTVLQCSHQHCVQPVASDVEVVRYL